MFLSVLLWQRVYEPKCELVDSKLFTPSVENLQCLASSGTLAFVVVSVVVPPEERSVPFPAVVPLLEVPLLRAFPLDEEMIERCDLGESQEVVKIKRARSGISFFINHLTNFKAWPISSLISSAIILNSLAKI